LINVWKDVVGFEGYYKVSDKGEIYSVKSNKIRKLSYKKNGYVYIDLYKDGKVKYCRVHRIVADAFIPNPNNYPYVMHIDNNKSNNCAENLKWGTASDNTKQAYEDGLLYSNIKMYCIYNDNDTIYCLGYKNIKNITGYKSSYTISNAIKNNDALKKGRCKGYKIKKIS